MRYAGFAKAKRQNAECWMLNAECRINETFLSLVEKSSDFIVALYQFIILLLDVVDRNKSVA